MFYTLTILICMIIISIVNIIFSSSLYNLSAFYIILAVIISTIAVILVDGLFAYILRWICPLKWFGVDSKFSKVSKKEQHFYEKLGIKKWKDKVLELGCFTKFRKNKLYNPTSVEYIERFIVESNVGFVIHIVAVPVGFLILFIFPLEYALLFGIPVNIVNIVLNLMPAFILRYNLPKLFTLRKRNLRNSAQTTNMLTNSNSDLLVTNESSLNLTNDCEELNHSNSEISVNNTND